MDVLDLRGGQAPPPPGTQCDVVVARDWEATAWLWDVDARRRVYAVDHLAHEALGAWQAERIAAAISYDLPVDFLGVGEPIAQRLREMRPDARVETVVPGVDHAPSVRPRAEGEPLRVAGATPELLTTMTEPHIAVAGLDDADVLVALDASLPLGGQALEAAVRGVVPIVLAGAPAEPLAAHLRSGIVAEADDLPGHAHWLDTLARDADLLATLRAGALELLASWPTRAQAAEQERAALQRLLDEPPPGGDAWGAHVMADALAAVTVWRNEHYRLAGHLQHIEADRAYLAAQRARALVRRVRRPRS